MTKKDLKTGMVVEVKKGTQYLVMRDAVVGISKSKDFLSNLDGGSFCELEDFTEDLKCKSLSRYDIMKVYQVRYPNALATAKDASKELLWERPTYYNGKVVCINDTANKGSLTVGKIYNIVDGFLIDDELNKRPYYGGALKTFEEFNTHCSARFIEVVE